MWLFVSKLTRLALSGGPALLLALGYSLNFACAQSIVQDVAALASPGVVTTDNALQCSRVFLNSPKIKDWGMAAPDSFKPLEPSPIGGDCSTKVWNQFQDAHFQCSNLQVSLSGGGSVPLAGCLSLNGPCYDNRDDCMTSVFFKDVRETLGVFATQNPGSAAAIWGYLPASLYNPVEQSDPLCLDAECGYTVNRSGRIYFNDRCEEVAGPATGLMCAAGELEFNLSPVSLIWEKGTDVDSEVNLTRFKILADNQERWVLWKGSSKAPLVVFDPEHNGVITSGMQLFGNWTLGGKRSASALTDIKLDEIVPSQPWSNGFEALRIMDRNGDRKLSADELVPLALWFDKNRDAISQPGEVVRMSDAGVTEIFFEGYMSEGAQSALRLKKGYTREVGGKRGLLTGESVDWFTDSSIEPSTLIQKLGSQVTKTPVNAPSVFADQDAAILPTGLTVNPKEILALDAEPSKNLGGLWFWQIMDGRNDDLIEKHGAFTLSDANDGRIRGRTWGFKFLRYPVEEANQVLQTASIEGSKKRSGGVTVEFGIAKDKSRNYSVRSNATLSPDGMSLEGVSVASFELGGKRIRATYRWVARRYMPTDSRCAFGVVKPELGLAKTEY